MLSLDVMMVPEAFRHGFTMTEGSKINIHVSWFISSRLSQLLVFFTLIY